MNIPKKYRPVIKLASYILLFLVSFVIFFYITFPINRLSNYIELKMGEFLNADIRYRSIKLSLFSGLTINKLSIYTKVEGVKVEKGDEKEIAIKEAKARGRNPIDRGRGNPNVKREPPLRVDYLRVNPSFFSMIKSVFGSYNIPFYIKIGPGVINARLKYSAKGGTEVSGKISNFQPEQIPQIQKWIPLKIALSISGEINLAIPEQKYSLMSGRIDLHIKKAQILKDKLDLKKFKLEQAIGPTWDLEAISLGEITGVIEVKKGELQVKKFTIKSKDVEGDMAGSIFFQDRLLKSYASLFLKFKFNEEYIKRAKLEMIFKLNEIKKAQKDGYFGLCIFRSLGELGVKGCNRQQLVPYRYRMKERTGPRLERGKARKGRERLEGTKRTFERKLPPKSAGERKRALRGLRKDMNKGGKEEKGETEEKEEREE